MKNKMAAAGVAASLMGGVVIGSFVTPPMAAFAEDTTTSTTASATARTPGQWITDALEGLVNKGTITKEQSDTIATTLKEAHPKEGRWHGKGKFIDLSKAAEVLGVPESDLRSQMTTKSLADIAKEKNVDVQKLIDALVAVEHARIDKSVADGKRTQAEADAAKARTVERVTNFVNSVRPAKIRGEHPARVAVPDTPTATS